MKLAAAFNKENNTISESFCSTKHFKIYDIENGSVICSEVVGTMQGDTEQMVGLLCMFEADGVICSSIEEEAETQLYDEGIELYSGFYGDPDEAVEFLTE